MEIYANLNEFFAFLETFHMNPRLCLSLQESGDIVMALNQHTAMDPKVIGFTGYPLSPSGKLHSQKEYLSLVLLNLKNLYLIYYMLKL